MAGQETVKRKQAETYRRDVPVFTAAVESLPAFGFPPRELGYRPSNPFSSNGNLIKLAGFSVSLHIRQTVTTSAHANPAVAKPRRITRRTCSMAALYYNFDCNTLAR